MKKYSITLSMILTLLCLTGCSNDSITEKPVVTATYESNTVLATAETEATVAIDTTRATETQTVSVAEQGEKFVLSFAEIEGTDISYYYDRNGRLVYEVWPEWGKTVEYIYGDGDLLVVKNEHGSVHYRTEYDSFGNPERRFQFLGEDGSGDKVLESEYSNIYDDAGRLMETYIEHYASDGTTTIKQIIRNEYFDGGHCEECTAYLINSDGSESLDSYEITYYNTTNQITEQRFHNASISIEYDDYGNYKSQTTKYISSEESKVSEIRIVEYENTYNAEGQLLRVVTSSSTNKYPDEHGVNVQTSVDWQYDYEYDDNGNRILERYTNCQSGYSYENIYKYAPLSETQYNG